MRKTFSLFLAALVLAASLPAAAGRRDAPPPEPTFVEQLIQILTGRRDVWVMPEVKGTL